MKKIITSFVALLSIVGGALSLWAEETYVVGVSDSNEVTVKDDSSSPIKYNWVKYSGYSYYAFDLNGLSYDLGLVVSNRKGYRFDGWYTLSSGKDGSGGPKDCDKKISTDLHITWSEITSQAATSSAWGGHYFVCPKFVKVWTVSASASPAEGGTVSGAGTVDEGASVTLTATPNDGYSFDSWSDGSNANPRKITGINADKTYTAVFTLKRYTLKVDPNGGTFMGSAEPYMFPVDRLTWGQKTLNSIGVATKSDGSELQGFRDLNGQPVYDAQGQNVKCDYWTDSYKNGGVFKGTSNLTVRAIWGEPPKRYTITATAEPNAAGTVLGADTCVEGVNVTLEAQPSPGYSFAHWLKGDEALTDNPLNFTASADAKYTAVFTGNVYTVTFSGEGGTPPSQTVDQTFGTNWNLPEVEPPGGKIFDGWYLQAGETETKLTADTPFDRVPEAPLVVHAKWEEPPEYTVTFVDPSEEPGRKNAPCETTCPNGDWIDAAPRKTGTWMATWRDEYWIAGWNPPLPVQATSNMTITAVRESIASVLDCESLKDSGWVFQCHSNWTVCTTESNAGNSCLMLERAGSTDTVTVNLPAGVGVLSFYWKSEAGEKMNVSVEEEGGERLDDFRPEADGTWKYEEIEIASDKKVTVTFSYVPNQFEHPFYLDTFSWTAGAKPRLIDVTSDGHGTVQPASGPHDVGSQLELTATADSGYAFCCWTNDTGFATNDNPWTFTVTDDFAVKATFTNAQYVVTLDPNGGTGGDASVIVTYDKPLPDLASLPSRTDGWKWTFNGYTNAAGVAYYDADCKGLKAWDQPNAATLFAQWKAPNQYSLTVTVTPEDRGSVVQDPPGGQFVADTIVKLEAKPEAGAAFAQWNDGVESPARTVTMTGDITLTATFTNCQYVVTFDANEGSVTPSTKIVTYGETYGDLPTPTRKGYEFGGWFTAASGGDKVESATNVATAADHVLHAHWGKAVSELSKALDCSNLDFTAAGGWVVFTNSAYAKEGVSCLSNSVPEATLATTVTAAGTLTFWWRGKGVDDFVRVKVSTNAVEIKSLELNVSADDSSGWEQKTLDVVASAEMPVTVKFEANKSRYNGVMALDFFTWVPAAPAHPEPTDADRVTISAAGVTDGKFTLSFTSDERFDYNLLTNANLLIDSWGKMEKKTGTGSAIVFEPEIIDGLPQLFYKVETLQKQD